MMLALVSPRNLVPGMTTVTDGNSRFCLFEVVPVAGRAEKIEIRADEQVYIRNK
jgi:hypothetical protein